MFRCCSSCFFVTFLLFVSFLQAEDFGVHGSVFAIEEPDLMDYILKKLESYSENSSMTSLNIQNETLKKLSKSINSPNKVEIGEANNNRIYYFDPTVTVQEDIKDHEGNIIVQRGTKFNPLIKYALGQDLLFFDATNSKQLAWAKKQSKNSKWILINGNPIKLEKELNRPVFFDQFGVIIGKLKIQNVPARVSQQDLKLKIEEFYLGDSIEK